MRHYSVELLFSIFALTLSVAAVAAPNSLRTQFACVTKLPDVSEAFLILREKPSADSAEVARLVPGAALQVNRSANGWTSVSTLSRERMSGWVNTPALEAVDDVTACSGADVRADAGKGGPMTPFGEKPTSAPKRDRATFACVADLKEGDFLSLRERPSANSGEIMRLPDGSALIVTGASGDWVSVNVPGRELRSGWVSGKYLARVADASACKSDTGVDAGKRPPPFRPAFACVANLAEGDFLSLREKPSPGANEILRLRAGSALRVTGSSGNWVSVAVVTGAPRLGWVNGKYLARVADASACKDVRPDTADNSGKPDSGKPDGGAGTPSADTDKPGSGETACDEAAVLDANGNPVFPQGATEITAPEDVEDDRGLLSDLYPTLDTTTDAFYASLPCEPSIGGTLPTAVDEPPTPGEVVADEYLGKFETGALPEVVQHIQLERIPDLPEISGVATGGCSIDRKVVPCDSGRFLSADQPFEGRDIIYVHGLETGDFSAWLHLVPGARQRWLGPQDPDSVAAYLAPNGYFRKSANEYWRAHIRENLFDPDQPSNPLAGWQYLQTDAAPVYVPKANRYLIVAWSSNDTIEYAQHALLSQIQLAITTNRNVVTPPTYPSSFARPFCSNGCIVISHSTGPLIVSSAMALASAGIFGSGAKQLPGRIFAQVSFEGAISGSALGTLGLAVGLASSPIPAPVCALVDAMLIPGTQCDFASTSFLGSSILRDLVPAVAQTVWGPWVEASPVRTVTVAGGHPIGKAFGALKYIVPGLDDGVISMNSACGNPAPVHPFVLAPSGQTVTSLVKAFDYSSNGGRLARAVKNFISNKNLKGPYLPPLGPLYLAGACTPYVSPTGMVMPVLSAMAGTPWDARRRYNNIHSFLQATTGHSYDGGSEASAGNPWPSAAQSPASDARHYLNFFSIYTENVEEASAVTESGIFVRDAAGTYLVKPIPIHEIVRGTRISFKLFHRRHTWWIWKRTYHLLDRWQVKQTTHYVYEFVARR